MTLLSELLVHTENQDCFFRLRILFQHVSEVVQCFCGTEYHLHPWVGCVYLCQRNLVERRPQRETNWEDHGSCIILLFSHKELECSPFLTHFRVFVCLFICFIEKKCTVSLGRVYVCVCERREARKGFIKPLCMSKF